MIETIKNQVIKLGVPARDFDSDKIRLPSLIYMFYWIERLKNNKEEQNVVLNNVLSYLNVENDILNDILEIAYDNDIALFCERYVFEEMIQVNTVDLVIEKSSGAHDKEILLYKRDAFPQGLALPGGIVNESDETNELGVDGKIFSALRVGAEKVLCLSKEDIVYEKRTDQSSKEYFSVSNLNKTKSLTIRAKEIYGYVYNENIKNVIRPSDPRHIANTVGYTCELICSDLPQDESYIWVSKERLLKPGEIKLSFNHHKEIIFHLLAKSNLDRELDFTEEEFIRNIIQNPLDEYRNFKKRFLENNNNQNTSFPELFTVVNKLLTMLFTEEINSLCEEVNVLNGMRDKVAISLRHTSLKNRVFCPYAPTIRSIFESITFFDVVARHKKNFYHGLPTDKIIEHNPREKEYSSYHMYRYKYRLDDIFSMIPSEIIIPTFASLSATDLMKIRGIPVRFVGLATDFLYVDEFEQSPEEFLMHDCNHSWRMIQEDNQACIDMSLSKDLLIEESNAFIQEYLPSIKINKTDTEEEREIKKIKKIILFEIVHEDARPFLRKIIGDYIQVKEGGEVRFELPRIDQETGYMDVVDTLDTGISTLSYVRNKLQHGFYDQVDSQLPQIVSPKYRKSEYIAKAAYQMLRELNADASSVADLDIDGLPTYEWLLRRVCSVGPDNIHNPNEVDDILNQYSDGVDKLNPKRYQA